MRVLSSLLALAGLSACQPQVGPTSPTTASASDLRFEVSIADGLVGEPIDGRMLVMLSKDGSKEPRQQIGWDVASQQVFGVDVDALAVGGSVALAGDTLGYPAETLADLEPGDYHVQALLNVYETFERADGHVVKLPMDDGEGQKWNRSPGNLYSTPAVVSIDPAASRAIPLTLDQVIPPIEPPKDSKYLKHIRIESKLLSEFWGRPMHLGAVVLLPEGFDEHPKSRYPLVVYQGHFNPSFYTPVGFEPEPPPASLSGYERTVHEYSHQFYRDWTSGKLPRVVIMTIQHANPYFDDSYAVNSQNVGPYGDAIMSELIPEVEKRFRAIGEGWARVLYGGSTGGWEAMAVQVFYPDAFNGAWINCPDPIDFRRYMLVDLYAHKNAYWEEGPFMRVPRPAKREPPDGRVVATMESMNRFELVLGTHSRSTEQFDIWEAVYSPVGDDGYPKRIFDKRTGAIDAEVAAHWRDNYDLGHILRRDWKTLGPKLVGKLHIKVGDMDNFYLDGAVRLVEEFLESTKQNPPYYAGTVEYGDGHPHCYSGSPKDTTKISRLTINQRFLPQMVERMRKTAPKGADLKSWSY